MKALILFALFIGVTISSFSQEGRDYYINGVNNFDQIKLLLRT